MSTTNIDLKKVRRALEARYFVQWMTEAERTNFRVVGYCVRDKHDSHWATVFEHEEHSVCEKICQILNEGANKC